MDFNFKSLPQLLKRFPDDRSARSFLEQKMWGGTPVCPFCKCDKWYKLKDGKSYKCGSNECNKKYTVTVGTFLHGSHLPLNLWFAAMYLMSSHRKGISSHQLARDLGITQKSAWFMLHRLRDMVREKERIQLSGVVEIDETYMARKYRSDYKGLPPEEIDYNMANQLKSKGMVLGMAERGGNVRAVAMNDNTGAAIWAQINDKVKPLSELNTDESRLYKTDEHPYYRKSVNHSRREWVRGDVHTNSIEGFWSVMKRGIYGIYHQISFKHLQRYCDEFTFRYNNRNIPDYERFSLSLNQIKGRLTYSQLIQREPIQKSKEENNQIRPED